MNKYELLLHQNSRHSLGIKGEFHQAMKAKESEQEEFSRNT